MQLRFRRQQTKRALRILDHPRFRAAYDLLRLRVAVGEEDAAVETFWTDLQSADPAQREAAVKDKPGGRRPWPARPPVGPRSPRRRRKPKAAGPQE